MNRTGKAFLFACMCAGFACFALGDAAPPTTAPTKPTTRPARAARPPLPDKHSSEILAMLLDHDAKSWELGRRYNLSRQIGRDAAEPDADVQKGAVDTLAKVSMGDVLDSGGRPIVPNAPAWCRSNLRPNILKLLLAFQQYDLIAQMAAKALSNGVDASGMDNAQVALANALLSAGKYDQALPAAKAYYDVCLLPRTPKATDLLAVALLHGPGVKDPDIVSRFKSEQIAGSQSTASDSCAPQTVMKSIAIDPAPYQAEVDKLASATKTYDTLTRQGNLLLLQDKGSDAVAVFQASMNLTNDPTLLSAAIANVARAMRARDGCIGPANAYLVSLQQSAQAQGN